MEQIDQMISDYFNRRYDYLTECAENILKLIKRPDLKSELVSECYIYIETSKNKLKQKITDGKLESICVSFMTMQVRWNKTNFKKNSLPIDHSPFINSEESNGHTPEDEYYPDNLKEEDVPTIEEMLALDKEMDEKLASIELAMLNEPLAQRLLFSQVFYEGYGTSGKLSQHTGIPRTNCYFLIKNLKDKLRNNYQNNIIYIKHNMTERHQKLIALEGVINGSDNWAIIKVLEKYFLEEYISGGCECKKDAVVATLYQKWEAELKAELEALNSNETNS